MLPEVSTPLPCQILPLLTPLNFIEGPMLTCGKGLPPPNFERDSSTGFLSSPIFTSSATLDESVIFLGFAVTTILSFPASARTAESTATFFCFTSATGEKLIFTSLPSELNLVVRVSLL